MKRDAKRVAVVTGASAGIGRATVQELSRRGFVVHAGARRVEAMRDLEERGALVHALDLTDAESIRAFVARVVAESGRVDVLVNNAGYGAYGAVEEMPISLARDQMEVNLFGLAQLIQAVLPAMRAQGSGRIVNVTSIGGKIWSPLGAWYHASKFAVEGFSDALRNEVRPFGIDVVVVEPGGTKTDWSAIALANMKKVSGAGPYRAFVAAWDKLVTMESGMATAADIGAVIAHASSVRKPRIRYVAPFVGRVSLWLRKLLTDAGFDWLSGRLFGLPKALTADGNVP